MSEVTEESYVPKEATKVDQLIEDKLNELYRALKEKAVQTVLDNGRDGKPMTIIEDMRERMVEDFKKAHPILHQEEKPAQARRSKAEEAARHWGSVLKRHQFHRPLIPNVEKIGDAINDVFESAFEKKAEDFREILKKNYPDGGPSPVFQKLDEKKKEEADKGAPVEHGQGKMRCATCMWFLPKMSMYGNPVLTGTCRRYPPGMVGEHTVNSLDWCGEHKLDEEKSK